MSDDGIAPPGWEVVDPTADVTESAAAPPPTVFQRSDHDVSVHVLSTTPGNDSSGNQWSVAVGRGDATGSDALYPVRESVDVRSTALDVAEAVMHRYDHRQWDPSDEENLRRLAESV